MKIASIDIGTNTIILLIADIINNQIIPLHNEYRIPRIGQGLKQSKYISDDKINELIKILSSYKDIIQSYGCDMILATGTNAFRIAQNSLFIINTVKEKLGIHIIIASSLEEARYSFISAISDHYKEANDVMVIDIGGGSTELISGNMNQIKSINSFQTGVVSGTEEYLKHDPPLINEINTFDAFLSSTFINLDLPRNLKAISIAGTPTTLACIQKRLKYYSEEEVEGSILKNSDLYRLKEELSILSSKQIKEKFKEVVSGREDVLLAGTMILSKLMNLLSLTEVVVSTKGIRYGVILDYMQKYYNKEI
jgi:exopolyphosphatase / guanosine-5'-triphosphate,3'-diphosphate pyrophosphatase